LAWRRYLWACELDSDQPLDGCPYSLTDRFGRDTFVSIPHQRGARWLSEIFSRSAARYHDHVALQIPHTGESLTYAELDARAEHIAAAVSRYLDGPDQVVAVAMSQDNWEIVAAHLGILKAGGTLMFLDTTLPDALIDHMLNDAKPVVALTRGGTTLGALPTIDVTRLPDLSEARSPPTWLDDPDERLATIFYTSGTTGKPKGVECPHSGYVNLALSYADYFDLLPGADATTLTSSLGYDGSISEMYSAWVSGCTVILLTREQIRSGPDLVPILREAEATVLFCPPILLTTLTATPEIDLPYPICRYVVPAGEAFPDALVEPWTRGRRQIINTYGPTEASTDTSRQSLRPGDAITIGTPFPNVTYVILEFEGLNPLAHGEEGELCIGGPHLSRGYRNLPEQTAKAFIDHPEFGRLYRTGDRCRIDRKTLRVHFLGRFDAQLKVRGHRVEAQAVENILQSQFREIEAAVLDYQNEALIAFVCAPSIAQAPISGATPAPGEWAARVTERLAEQLPESSVPSRIFLVGNFEMKPVSGKIDRKRLPDVAALPATAETNLKTSKNGEVQKADLAAIKRSEVNSSLGAGPDEGPNAEDVLEICRSVFEAPIGWDDAFADVGGHSIIIARLAQRLHASGRPVSVRALLSECNTARKLAERQPAVLSKLEPSSSPVRSKNPADRPDAKAAQVLPIGLFTLLQIVFLLILYAPGLLAFLTFFGFADIGLFFTTANIWSFVIVGTLFYLLVLAVPFVELVWAMFVKLLLGGHIYKNNIQAGAYPKWSRMHLRIWCIDRLQSVVLTPLAAMYRSAPLTAFALRQLGAKVGRNLQCASDASFFGPLDLVSVDDDVAIQTGARICTARWEAQELHIGPLHLESGCKIGMRAGVFGHVTVGRDSWIAPLTPIRRDVGPGELWEGSPARATGRHVRLKRAARSCRPALPSWLLEALNISMQISTVFMIIVLPTELILWGARELSPFAQADLVSTFVATAHNEAADAPTAVIDKGGVPANYFTTAPIHEIFGHLAIYAFATMWLILVLTSLLACLFIRFTATTPGIYASHGLRAALLMYRISILNTVQRVWTWTITSQYLRALSGVKFNRIGASECDVMFNLVPEVTCASSKVFWSNGSFTNVLDYDAKHIALRQIEMPPNFFTGNYSVAENGALPDNFMLGVSTPCSDILYRRQMRSRLAMPIALAGNPPLAFASASFQEEDQAHHPPGFYLFLQRILLNDIFSIGFLRITEALIFALTYIVLYRVGFDPVLGALISLILAEAGLVGLTVLLKRGLVGKEWGSNHTTAFWSTRHFTYFFVQDCFFNWCRGTLGLLRGTILANGILRKLGCQIGARTIVMDPMQCSDWNAVLVGSDCILDGILQLHTFENMLLQVKETRIGNGTTIASGATVMKGAVLDRDVTLRPLSMVLKEMHIPAGIHEGSPAEKLQI
jgi:non-ribosomal peptide synthetase-like protein